MHVSDVGLQRLGFWLASLVVQLAPQMTAAQDATTDSAAVAAVIREYHDALSRGDSTAALSLLADDAIILEGGGIETRDEYRSGHLRGDIGFAMSVSRVGSDIAVTVRGDVAWAASTSTTQGVSRGREIDSRGAELAVLTRQGGVWRIHAIHWSSRNVRPR